MQFGSTETFCHTKTRFSSNIFLNILSFWHKKLCIQSCYSSKPFLTGFVTFCSKIGIRIYIKQFSTERLDIVQNVLIFPSPKIPKGLKCANTPTLDNTNTYIIKLVIKFTKFALVHNFIFMIFLSVFWETSITSLVLYY